MAKKPDLETILYGPTEKSKLNKNFKAIADKFEESLSRTGVDYPNFMDVDLDVSDANITNTNKLIVNSFNVATKDFTGFSEQYVYKLGLLECGEGAIITHNADGDPICFAPGDNGEVLKTRDGGLNWEEDIDTDTDTVGVTVQEDGVTVAENVTVIDFKWTGSDLITTPAANQVDLEMDDLLGPLFEDTTQADSNLDPSPDVVFNNSGEVTRVDLSTLSGVSLPLDGTEYTVVAEASNYFTDTTSGGESQGTWVLDVRFYEDDGTSTPLTGTEINVASTAVTSTVDGGRLLTLFRNIPANTKYVDFGWSLIRTFPIGTLVTNFCDRYRAIIPQGTNGTFQTPNGHTTQDARAPTCPIS